MVKLKTALARVLTTFRAHQAMLEKGGNEESEKEGLLQTNNLWRATFEAASEAIIVIDGEGRIILVNAGTEQLFGYKRSELLGQPVEILIPDCFQGIHVQHRAEYLNHPRIQPMSAHFKPTCMRKDGSEFVSQIGLNHFKRGDETYGIALVTDISKQEQITQELLEFRQAIDTAGDVIFLTDREGIFTYVNPEFTRLYGYEAHEIVGKMTPRVIKSDQLTPQDYEMFWHELLNKQVVKGRLINKDKEGNLVYVEASANPILDEQGEITGFLAVQRDLAERLEMEEADREQRELIQALMETTSVINSTLDLDEVLDRILNNVARVLPHDASEVMLIDPDGDTARVFRCRGYAERGGKEWALSQCFSVSETANLQHMLQTGQPITITDLKNNPEWVWSEETQWMGSSVGAPIRHNGSIMGFLNLYNTVAGSFNSTIAEQLQAFADQAAIALRNAQLFEAEQERALKLELISQLGQTTTSIMEPDELLNQAVTLISSTFNYRNTTVLIVEGRDLVLKASSWAAYKPIQGKFRLRIGSEGISGWVAENRKPLLVSDVSHSKWYYPALAGEDIKSELAVPIMIKDQVLGVLDVQSGALNALTEDDIEILQTLAGQLAVAIQNAQLYQELGAYSEYLEQAVEVRTNELRRTKQRVETILYYSPDPILLLKFNGTIDAANPAFKQVFGYDLNELSQETHLSLIAPGCIEALQNALQRAIERREVERLELIVSRKNGTSFDAALALAPIDGNGRVGGFVCTIRDISAPKEIERMKDAFVSNVSHELRTPITGLKLNLSLLGLDPDRQAIYVDRLGREIDRLNILIEDLLRLSRLDQGRVELQLESVDLNILADEHAQDRSPIAEDKQLTLSFTEWKALPPTQADQGLLGQVLSILLTNAINYTPAGGEIHVSTQLREVDGKHWVGFSVHDTGPGIPADEIPKLFERFYRGEVGLNSGVSGTGLGLAIAQEIVLRHKGQIEVLSDGIPGKGTTFEVWLPAEE